MSDDGLEFRLERVVGGYVDFKVLVDIAPGPDRRLYIINRTYASLVGSPRQRGMMGETNIRQIWRALIWSLDDELVKPFGSEEGADGARDGQCVWPSGIAVNGDRVYITDEARHDVQVFDLEGNFIDKWGGQGGAPGQFNGPAGIVFDARGYAVIADALNHRVQVLTPRGDPVCAWGSQGSRAGELNRPWGVAVGREGDVYVADWSNDRVQRFSADGAHVRSYGMSGDGPGDLRRPSGVAVDADGIVYVADRGNDRVQVFDPFGTRVATLLGDGTLSKTAMQIYASRPELSEPRAREGFAAAEDERGFRWPTSVKIDAAGRLHVADTGFSRVQIFEKLRRPTGQDAWRANDWLARDYAAAWLERAALYEHARELRALPAIGSAEAVDAMRVKLIATREAARAAAWKAGRDAFRGKAWDTARDLAWGAVRRAASNELAQAARDTAMAAAWAAPQQDLDAAARAMQEPASHLVGSANRSMP